ncbi:hypothetical protein C0075_25535 [Rhizobium sp. KAs_5_22]|nr:hypothetical protein C0075_25535 [Rhizobium sp. KAs_5_22]
MGTKKIQQCLNIRLSLVQQIHINLQFLNMVIKNILISILETQNLIQLKINHSLPKMMVEF